MNTHDHDPGQIWLISTFVDIASIVRRELAREVGHIYSVLERMSRIVVVLHIRKKVSCYASNHFLRHAIKSDALPPRKTNSVEDST